MKRVLFCCMGNICRSPTAEAVARRKAREAGLGDVYQFDSAGTHGYHVGEAPDARSQAAGSQRGYDLSPLRARQCLIEDFDRFDLILAMDRQNLTELARLCPHHARHKLKLLLSFGPDQGVDEVPDPYYGGTNGFERVLDLIEGAIEGLLADHTGRSSKQQDR